VDAVRQPGQGIVEKGRQVEEKGRKGGMANKPTQPGTKNHAPNLIAGGPSVRGRGDSGAAGGGNANNRRVGKGDAGRGEGNGLGNKASN